ncbi:MAG: hypothetical protein KAI17_01225 [Thiotrichaceae bacterium]|nr:hypothetical protein [Thiotrichaceae bacterium]
MLNVLKAFSYLPLFFVVGVIYIIMVFAGVNFGDPSELFHLSLPSGANWMLTSSDIFLMLGVVTLFIEIIKSTRTGTGTILEHTLSMLVFLTFLMFFLFWGSAGTSPFLVVTLMSLLDVIAGFTITVATARRDFNMGG